MTSLRTLVSSARSDPAATAEGLSRASRGTGTDTSDSQSAIQPAADDAFVRLNVGGKTFELERAALRRCGGKLSQIADETHREPLDRKGRIRLNVDGESFRYTAHYGRCGRVPHALSVLEREMLLDQADTLGLQPLSAALRGQPEPEQRAVLPMPARIEPQIPDPGALAPLSDAEMLARDRAPVPSSMPAPAGFKQELLAAQEVRRQHQAFLSALTTEQLETAARHVRGQSRAQGNCVHLAQALLTYLHTGELPSFAATRGASVCDFAVEITERSAHIKPEQDTEAATSGWAVASTVVHAGVLDAFVPAERLAAVERVKLLEVLDEPGIDLTQFRQVPMDADEVTSRLTEMAHQAKLRGEAGCYGCVNLAGDRGESGHCLVYVARADQVWFIDAQRINRGVGQAVHTSLRSTVDFPGGASLLPQIRTFQRRVFLLPAAPACAAGLLRAPAAALNGKRQTIAPGGHHEPNPKRNKSTALQAIEARDDAQASASHQPLLPSSAPKNIYNDSAELVNVGTEMFKQNKFTEALAAYDRGLQLDPNNCKAHLNLGTVLARQNKLPQALAAFDRGLQLDPNSCKAHLNRGTVLARQNKLSEALAAFGRASELQPNSSKAHFARGYLLMKQNKLPEALAAANRALQLDPNNEAVVRRRAQICERLGLDPISWTVLLSGQSFPQRADFILHGGEIAKRRMQPLCVVEA